MGLTVLDAGVLIGFLDASDAHHDAAHREIRAGLERGDRVSIPASAFAEVLVGPSRRGNEAVKSVQEFVERVPIDVAPLDAETAVVAADLRARHGSRLRLPDALVIATARDLDADALVTADRNWPTRRALRLRARLVIL
ncbi:MAG: PIN domain-containing protein [Acidimicrobiia bacterium]